MTRFSEAIADHLEHYGIEGLQVGKQTITLADLRAPGSEDFSREQVWAEAHKGQRVKRPKGRTIYTVAGWAANPVLHFGPLYFIELRKDDGSTVTVGWADADRMVDPDQPLSPPSSPSQTIACDSTRDGEPCVRTTPHDRHSGQHRSASGRRWYYSDGEPR